MLTVEWTQILWQNTGLDFQLTDLLNGTEPFAKEIIVRLFNKFPIFYWTWRLICVFARDRCARWTKSRHFHHIYLIAIFNIIIPFMPGSAKPSLSFLTFLPSVCVHFWSIPCILRAPSHRHSFDHGHNDLRNPKISGLRSASVSQQRTNIGQWVCEHSNEFIDAVSVYIGISTAIGTWIW